MKLGPDSAGCHGETTKTLASVTLSGCFQRIGWAPPALGELLIRSRLGHVVAAQLRAHTDREVKVQEGAVDEEPHTRAPSPLGYLQLLQGTSEQGPASRGILPNTPPPPPLPLTPRPLPARPIDTAPGIFRISWWAGLGCDFVPESH